MFEQASRLKLRFDTPRGKVTTEDLWSLPLTSKDGLNLDDIAKGLNRDLKQNEEESFVVKKSTANTTLELKFNIVKRIISVKLDEIKQKENKLATDTQKDKLKSLIERKQDEALAGKSVEELNQMLNSLQ